MEHSTIKELKKIAEKTALKMDGKLIELNCKESDDELHIEVVIYSTEGTSLDHYVEFSRSYDKEMTELNINDGPYFIEVASPDLDGLIKSDDDLRRNLGKKVEIKLYKEVNNRKDLTEKIADYSEEEVVVRADSSEERIPREIMSLIRQVIEFWKV